MPFNVWCTGCERHIARGVRFNAEKRTIGKYHSTPILSFSMACPSCPSRIVIHTDPASAEYLVISGARRKLEGVEDPEAVGVKAPKSKEEAAKLIYNPFFKLEHDYKDAERSKEVLPRLKQIAAFNEDVWREDFVASQAARKRLRLEKEDVRAREAEVAALKARLSIQSLPLLPEHEEDVRSTKLVRFDAKDEAHEAAARLKCSSIFGQPKASGGTGRKQQDLVQKLQTSKGSILTQLELGSRPNRR